MQTGNCRRTGKNDPNGTDAKSRPALKLPLIGEHRK